GLTRRIWTAPDWTWSQGTARLEMMTAAPAAGFAVALDQVPANGSLVGLRLDGAAVGDFTVRPLAGAPPALRVAAPLGRGLHVLALEGLYGGHGLPGAGALRCALPGPRRRRRAEEHRQGHGVARHRETEVQAAVHGEGDQG